MPADEIKIDKFFSAYLNQSKPNLTSESRAACSLCPIGDRVLGGGLSIYYLSNFFITIWPTISLALTLLFKSSLLLTSSATNCLLLFIFAFVWILLSSDFLFLLHSFIFITFNWRQPRQLPWSETVSTSPQQTPFSVWLIHSARGLYYKLCGSTMTPRRRITKGHPKL